jgi:hypothetical protein
VTQHRTLDPTHASVTMSAPRPGARWLVRTLLVVLARPRLWGIAIRQSLRLARPGWWRRPPFLPVPDAAYLRFRLLTMYGSDQEPDPADIVPYLEWCRSWPDSIAL